MPKSEIGKTGIKVSKFGFGSHQREYIVKYEKEREWMIREACDLGVNLFDVYDSEFKTYQYEPTGRYLADVINNVVISVICNPTQGRTVEQEIDRMLRVFGRDYIDLVRIHSWKRIPDSVMHLGHKWEWWETLFKLKEKGYIRAVGIPIHVREYLEEPLRDLPLDFVILPFNFYHNWSSTSQPPTEWEPLIPLLRSKGIGIITMKPFTGDYCITPFARLAKRYDKTGEFNFAKACLRYIINSNVQIDATLGGMFFPYHVYENVDAYFNPVFSDLERSILKKVREKARFVAKYFLPEHYKFLEKWVPDSWDDSDLFGTV